MNNYDGRGTNAIYYDSSIQTYGTIYTREVQLNTHAAGETMIA